MIAAFLIAGSFFAVFTVFPKVASADDKCVNDITFGLNQVQIDRPAGKYSEKFRLYFYFFTNKLPDCQNPEIIKTIHFKVKFDYCIGNGLICRAQRKDEKDYTAAPMSIDSQGRYGLNGGVSISPAEIYSDKTEADMLSGALLTDHADLTISVVAYQEHSSGQIKGVDLGKVDYDFFRNDSTQQFQPPKTIPVIDSAPYTFASGSDESWTPEQFNNLVSMGVAKNYRLVAGEDAKIKYKMEWTAAQKYPNLDGQDDFNDPRERSLVDPDIDGLYVGIFNAGNTGQCDANKEACEDLMIGKVNTTHTISTQLRSPGVENVSTLPWNNIPGRTQKGNLKEYYEDQIKTKPECTAAVPSDPKLDKCVVTRAYGAQAVIQLSDSISLSGWGDFNLEKGAKTFNVEVFRSREAMLADCEADFLSANTGKTAADAKAACAADPNTDGTITPSPIGTAATEAPTDALGPVLSFLGKVISGLIRIFSSFLYAVFVFFIAPFIEALLSIKTYTGDFAAVIYPGWEVLRNISNIFFIIALLAIALTTIFRVQGYQWKHMLVELVIAAILVNFSLVIGQSILGIADTVQNQFLPNNRAAISQLGKELMVAPIEWNSEGAKISPNLGGGLGDLILPLFYLAITLASFVMFFALMVFLAIRIVMLWILLMLSPMAYALRVLKATDHYAKEWWSNFLKYAFFTPIIALFLNVAALILQNQPKVIEKLSLDAQQQGLYFYPLLIKAGSAIVMMIFIFAAIKVAQAFSIFGAAALTGAAEKGLKLPFGKLQGLGKAGKEYVQEKVQDSSLRNKQRFANLAASERGGATGKVIRGIGKTALVSDYLKEKKHIREEGRKIKQEQFGAALHDATHVHGGKASRDARTKLEEKFKGETQKEFDGKTVKEILESLEAIRHSNKTDPQKKGAELAALTELAKRKEFDAILKSNKIEGTDNEAVRELLAKLVEQGRIDSATADRYAGRLNDIFTDNKQFQKVGVDVAHKLDFDQEMYDKFAGQFGKDNIPELQQMYKDVKSGKTLGLTLNSDQAKFINELDSDIKTKQIKKLVRLSPGEFAKNVKGATLEDTVTDKSGKKTKVANDLAYNVVVHMSPGHLKQRDKLPDQIESLRKLADDPNLVDKIKDRVNVHTGQKLGEAQARTQAARIKAYVNGIEKDPATSKEPEPEAETEAETETEAE